MMLKTRTTTTMSTITPPTIIIRVPSALQRMLAGHPQALRSRQPSGCDCLSAGAQPGLLRLPAVLALPDHPLDGQHAVRIEHAPPVIARDLNEPSGRSRTLKLRPPLSGLATSQFGSEAQV